MDQTTKHLFQAEEKAKELFQTVEKLGLIRAGKSERQLCHEILDLAQNEFGLEVHWGKKIVRAGFNTLQPYSGEAPDVLIQEDDILFFDFHPVFQGWEADLGRTYVLGYDPLKLKIKKAVEQAWYEGNAWYFKQSHLTGAEFYQYCCDLAHKYGYEFGNAISGHIIGPYPHEQPDDPNDLCLDAHPDNHVDILQPDRLGMKRHWMLELHFVDRKNNIGAFFEQLLDQRLVS